MIRESVNYLERFSEQLVFSSSFFLKFNFKFLTKNQMHRKSIDKQHTYWTNIKQFNETTRP